MKKSTGYLITLTGCIIWGMGMFIIRVNLTPLVQGIVWTGMGITAAGCLIQTFGRKNESRKHQPEVPQPYQETIIPPPHPQPTVTPGLPNITWYEETESFQSLREADEWISSDAYNKIGHDYDGYITRDPKLAYALVYQLVRNHNFLTFTAVRAEESFKDNTTTYYVWVEKESSH